MIGCQLTRSKKQAISPSFWGALSDVWGRRPVYLSTMVVYIGACIGLALTKSYPLLLVLRMIQAFGSSSVVAIGAGTIGKYYYFFAPHLSFPFPRTMA